MANLGKIQKESNFTARSGQSRRDVENLAANSTRFEKPTNIIARSLRSRHDICWFLKHHGEVSTNLGEMEDISPRSRRDLEFHERHGEISTISARSRQSRRVLGNLGEMEHISPRSRRDLESNKNHGEISARSLQSRRDLLNLDHRGPAQSVWVADCYFIVNVLDLLFASPIAIYR